MPLLSLTHDKGMTEGKGVRGPMERGKGTHPPLHQGINGLYCCLRTKPR